MIVEEIKCSEDVLKRNSMYSKMCYSMTTFFFSRIGLCLLVIAYSVGGGFIFKAIEAPSERKDIERVQESLDVVVRQLLNQSNKYLVLIEKNWTTMARNEILKYQEGIIRAVKQRGYLGSKHDQSNLLNVSLKTVNEQWNTAGAVLYAVTVITSIGYGNITCKTDAGRLLTMLYASCGIPLILIFLANIGSTLADSFRFVYSRLCCAYCHMITQRRRRRWIQQRMFTYPLMAQKSVFENEDIQLVSVPLSVTVILLLGYIFVGAFLFSQWEDWSLLDGFYFCFVTLTTIGLGDFVPGRSLSPKHSFSLNDVTNDESDTSLITSASRTSSVEGKLVLCALYLTIGLSLLVMCFNLMEEEVRAKCRRIGIQLGIFDDEDFAKINPPTRTDQYYAMNAIKPS